ncbi:5-oxoprolinase subunit PxpA [Colwelliaceae bacterium 6441]
MLTLNCDLGELVGEANNDALIMPLIDQANIACGFHAGDAKTMRDTVALAVKHQVSIGAHPSYPDRNNFGRTSMNMEDNALKKCITEQVAALHVICQAQNTQLSYIKPHGALYNDMMASLAIFETICQAISIIKHPLSLMMQALPELQQYKAIAEKYHIPLIFEGFADRAYQSNGLLVRRSHPGALLNDPEKVLARITRLINQQQLTSIDGKALNLTIDSLCVHGDNKAALALLTSLRRLINDSI